MAEQHEPTRRHDDQSPTPASGLAAFPVQAADPFQKDSTVRALLEALAEAVILIDRTGTIVHVNQRTVEMFGYPPEEIIGASLNKLMPARFHEIHRKHIEQFFERPHIRPLGHGLDLVGKRKNNTEFPMEISLSYFNTDRGAVALAFCTDATRRKQVENDLKLRNEQLDAFAHTVAHDLNSSLAVVVGFSEQLAETYDSLSLTDLHKYLLTIARSGRKMSNIINELLLFASMRQEEVTHEPLNMPIIVGEAVQRLRETINQRQAEVILPASYLPAMGHAPWVEEIWYNYLSNALKYGGQPPRIEIGNEQLDNGQVRFWVRDNGRGLTADQQTQLFVPYSQLDHPQIKGHGLGLSIVRQIVEKLGGQVGVNSEGIPGQGSTFFFTLPSADEAPVR